MAGNKPKKPNQKMQEWIDARKRLKLSHAQVQMARELGMNESKKAKKAGEAGAPSLVLIPPSGGKEMKKENRTPGHRNVPWIWSASVTGVFLFGTCSQIL